MFDVRCSRERAQSYNSHFSFPSASSVQTTLSTFSKYQKHIVADLGEQGVNKVASHPPYLFVSTC